MRGNKLFRVFHMKKEVESYLNLIDYKIQRSENELERYSLLGERDSLTEMFSNSRKPIFKYIQESHEEISILKEDIDLFNLNIAYLEGYIKGCKRLLDLKNDREAIKKMKILGFVLDENIGEIITMLFESLGFIKDSKLESNLSIYLSSNVEELNNHDVLDDVFACVFIFKKLKSPFKYDLDSEQRIHITELKEELMKEYPNKTKHDDIFYDVKKLNKNWVDTQYIYISNILSIESIITSLVRDVKCI